MERVRGIEPPLPPWEGGVEPLNYTRERSERMLAILTKSRPLANWRSRPADSAGDLLGIIWRLRPADLAGDLLGIIWRLRPDLNRRSLP